MKKAILIVLATTLSLYTSLAQNIEANLEKASDAYASANIHEARNNLKGALVELNKLLGEKILATYPEHLAGINYKSENDIIMGGMGFAELMVEREYRSANESIKLTLANDSPMLTIVNAFFENKMLTAMMGSQTGQREVKVNGYKAMLEDKSEDSGPGSTTISIPLGDSLLTIESFGFTPDKALELANKVNIAALAELIR